MKAKTLTLSLSFLVVLIVCFQISIAVNAGFIPLTPPPPATLLWADPVDVNDIALSKDGRYVAVASSLGVLFYNRTSVMPKTPMWTYTAAKAFLSVAISADGDCVAAGNSSRVYFWKNTRSLTGTPDPTWSTVWLGAIEYRSLDISDDGNYVVASGTGDSVYYWGDAKGKSGPNIATTWEYHFGYHFAKVHAVDLSSDGNYVVAGTNYDAGLGYAAVAYWKNARLLTGHSLPNWNSTEPDSNDVIDVAVSDDGNYVAAAATADTVYYWADAESRTGTDEPSTWYGGLGVQFTSIDVSSDGDKVIAGASIGVYFWSGARSLHGKPQDPSWTYDTLAYVWDVAINAAGDYMAAADGTRYVYFFDNTGSLKWQYGPLDNTPFVLSISSDGGTLAVGTGPIATPYLLDTGYRTTKAVGGLAVPPDKLALLSPWIAVALAAVAITVFATKRRRKP